MNAQRYVGTSDFEPMFQRMADRAMARRKVASGAPPAQSPILRGLASRRLETVMTAMGDRWMTARAIARRTELRVEQVQETFYRIKNRGKFEKRSLDCRNGLEWRVRR